MTLLLLFAIAADRARVFMDMLRILVPKFTDSLKADSTTNGINMPADGNF